MELPTGNERYFRMSVEEFDTEKLLTNAARQRDQRGFDDVLIIDVDAHHYETESMIEIVEFIEDPVLRRPRTASTATCISATAGWMLWASIMPAFFRRRCSGLRCIPSPTSRYALPAPITAGSWKRCCPVRHA